MQIACLTFARNDACPRRDLRSLPAPAPGRLASCSDLPRETAAPVHGRLERAVEPDPIIAAPVTGDVCDLKFDIIMR